MNNKYILGAVVLVVILGLGAFLLFGNKSASLKQNQTANQNTQTTPAQQTKNVASTTVEVTSSGFTPQEIKIKAGTRVVWTNKSGTAATVNSDPHPTHTLWPFLNLGSFDDGSSVSVVFEKTGKYTYHNHFNPEQKGTVVVE